MRFALTMPRPSRIVPAMSAAVRIGVVWFLGAFVAMSLFAASMSWLFTVWTGASMWTLRPDASATLWYVVVMNLVYWGSWGPLAMLVLVIASRWRIDASSWRRTVPLHFVAGFVVACMHIAIVATGRTLLQRSVGMQVSWEERLWDMFLRTIDWEVMLYWALVALQHAVDYYTELRARDVRQAQLETRLVEAQLQALQRQLHPHFLFNTLHAISALVHREPEKADEMIERLSDLLRITLDKVGIQEVTLAEELEYLRAYLDIEQVHFGDRLEVLYRVDAHALDALVPNLILQPLAENAIRHGLEPRAGGGRLTMEAFRDRDRLVLRIADNGCGMPAAAVSAANHGVGLSNTRSRLDRLYRDEATLTFAPHEDGGLIVTITLPLKQPGPASVAPWEVARETGLARRSVSARKVAG